MSSTKLLAFIVTISDTRSLETDESGETLAQLLVSANVEIVGKLIVSDDLDDIRSTLMVLSDRDDVNLVLTTGGTGFAPRDNTPEATRDVIDREAPGIAEAMRRETAEKTPMAMLSRGVAGVRNGTLIINMPGSPKAVAECFEVIRPVLQHAVNLLAGESSH
ncbi:MAG TPA: MogA/MoaB family molybdenum cofactor biosynthesis protein [Pyrinomonadaceae bacterium]|nr:MogA/MoaB family molybdenum cofactor biosynthesis protein [Pyrinomonadaceae bacterium]